MNTVATIVPTVAATAGATTRALPPPRQSGGMPLPEALALRCSTRADSAQGLTAQELSDVLWAAFGINRLTGDRTAPYWRHVMVIEIYLTAADGVWVYDATRHDLSRHSEADLRGQTGHQTFVSTAPLNHVYVAHGERMADVSPAGRRLYASVDAAPIGQNGYLHGASAGLGTVFRGALDATAVATAPRLPAQEFVTLIQPVGHPAPEDATSQS